MAPVPRKGHVRRDGTRVRPHTVTVRPGERRVTVAADARSALRRHVDGIAAAPDSEFRRSNYSGYLVSRDAVLSDLARQGIAPAFENVVCEHVTYRYPDPDPAPPFEEMRVVGHAVGDGVQAVLIEVDGTSERGDGELYHITVSLAEGHKPHESKLLVREGDVTPVEPFTVDAAAF